MNLDQYRAIKAQETQQSTPATVQTPVEPTQTKPIEAPVTKVDEPTAESTPIATPVNTKIVVNGIGEVDIEELKNGYLRQSDYTKKTQEISAKNKQNEEAVALYEYLRQNPQIAQQMLQNPGMQNQFNPTNSKLSEIEERMYDLMLQNDIRNMQDKYKDFDTQAVLKIADSKGITNLEDAYLIYRATKPASEVSVEDMKKQLREELIKEFANEQKGTQTLISSGATPIVQENKPSLSEKERKVAINMGLTEADYVKWRDMDKRK